MKEEIEALQVLAPLWYKYQDLIRAGKVVGEYLPDWWLNRHADPMELFFKWVLSEANKPKRKLTPRKEEK